MKSLAPVVLAAAAVAASALTFSATAQPSPKPSPACFWQRSVTNFAAVDTSRVYLRAGNRVFELALFANCLQLNWVQRLALRSRGSSNICEGPNPGLDVIVRNGIPGAQRCPVTGVRQLTKDEVAALPPRARP